MHAPIGKAPRSLVEVGQWSLPKFWLFRSLHLNAEAIWTCKEQV